MVARPKVQITGDLALVTATAEQVLREVNATDPDVFEMGGKLVRVDSTGTSAQFVVMNVDRLRRYFSEVSNWGKKASKQWKQAFPPLDVVRSVLAGDGWGLPEVTRLVTTPVFSSDGTWVDRPGYSESGRLVYVPTVVVPVVPTRPTPDDLARAKTILLGEALGDFPFVSDADHAHAVGAMLVPLVRSMIAGPTPFHLINAPAKGTGKTLLGQVIRYPATGSSGGVLPEVGSEDELRKRLTAVLLAGHATVLFDNLTGHLNSSALTMMLTATVYEDRRLGQSEMVWRPNQCLWLGTGNGCTLSDDLRRRTVPILLDAEMEEPHRRPTSGFRHGNLLGWASANRGEMIWALAVLVQQWQASGCPAGEQHLGSFEDWASVVGGILATAGIGGFLGNLDEWSAGADPVTEGWRLFSDLWWDEYETAHVKVSVLLPLYLQIEDDFLGVGSGSERSQVTALGRALSIKRNAIVGNRRLVEGKSVSGSKSWRLIPENGD